MKKLYYTRVLIIQNIIHRVGFREQARKAEPHWVFFLKGKLIQ